MAKVFPFKAIRPVANKVHLITTRSYISYTKAQLKRKLASNPFSFIHVLNPQIETKEISLKEKFKQVGRSFKVFLAKKYFIEENTPSLYVYSQKYKSKSFTGVVSLVSLEDYKNSIIKKHELTLEVREEMFKNYLNETQIHAEPVLLTYKAKPEIREIITKTTNQSPLYDFVTHDEVQHSVWKIDCQEQIEIIQSHFKEVNALYIADGHHRSASSLRLYEELNNSRYSKFLSFLLSDEELDIKGYHRIIDLGKYTAKDFLIILEKYYAVQKIDSKKIDSKKGIYVFVNQQWFEIKLIKTEINSEQQSDLLPVEYFTNNIILKELKVRQIRKSKRIKYIDSSCSAKQFEEKTNKIKNAVGVVLPALTTSELMNISDQNRVLPPKSTWIEPKLRSALFIYKYDN